MGVREIATMKITSHCCLFCSPCVWTCFSLLICMWMRQNFQNWIGSMVSRIYVVVFFLCVCLLVKQRSWYLCRKYWIFDVKEEHSFIHSFICSLIWFDVNRQNGFFFSKNRDYFLQYDWFQLFLLCICTSVSDPFHFAPFKQFTFQWLCVYFSNGSKSKAVWLKSKWMLLYIHRGGS